METQPTGTGNVLADTLLSLRDWALSQWEISLFLAVFAFWRWWFGQSYAEADSRAGLISFLRQAQAANAYKLLVSWLLDRTDRWFLSPTQMALHPEHRPAWSVKLYDRTLLLAVIYPILSVYAVWAITDRNSPFGDTVLIFGDVPWEWRSAAMGGLAATILLSIVAATRRGLGARIGWMAASFLFAASATSVISVRMLGEDIVGMAVSHGGAVAGGYVFTGVVAVACAGLVAFSGRAAGAFAFTGIATLSLVGAVEGEWLYPASVAIGNALGMLGAYIEILATLFSLTLIATATLSALLVACLVVATLNRGAGTTRIYAALTLVTAGALLLGRSQGWPVATNLLFLGTLPLLNALFDFCSIGLTRWALRRGIQRVGGKTIGYSLLDLAGATALLLGLGCAGLMAIHALNQVGAEPVLLLAGGEAISARQCQDGFAISPDLFHAVRTCPGDYWWLYVIFLSTILPTLVHSMIALWAIGPAMLGGRVRRWLAATLATSIEHFGWRSIALSVLSAWAAASVAIPIVIVFWTGAWLAENHPDLGLVLLALFEGFYGLLPGA